MVGIVPRVLLLLAALIFAAGGVIHALAFSKALAVLNATNMPDFYLHSLQALWLIDSATLVSLAIIFLLIAARPAVATRWLVVLLALIPAATAGLVYFFVGPFFPPHTLMAASLLVVIAGMQFPDSRARNKPGTAPS